MDSVTPPRNKRSWGAALIVAAPLVLLLIGTALLRGLHGASPPLNESDEAVGAPPAPSLSPNELSALNEARLQTDESDAYQAAQEQVRKFLLHPDTRISARFPGRLTSRSVTIEKQSPTRFRVRGFVEWQPEEIGSRVQMRRFEADLRHGPADDKWHLIDTEFLNEAAR